MTLFDLLDETLDARFRRFHAENPHVYEQLRDLALQLRRAGHERCGVKMLFEVLRWQRMLSTTDPEGWKLNNSYTSRYARLLEDQEPELADFFELRRLQP